MMILGHNLILFLSISTIQNFNREIMKKYSMKMINIYLNIYKRFFGSKMTNLQKIKNLQWDFFLKFFPQLN